MAIIKKQLVIEEVEDILGAVESITIEDSNSLLFEKIYEIHTVFRLNIEADKIVDSYCVSDHLIETDHIVSLLEYENSSTQMMKNYVVTDVKYKD